MCISNDCVGLGLLDWGCCGHCSVVWDLVVCFSRIVAGCFVNGLLLFGSTHVLFSEHFVFVPGPVEAGAMLTENTLPKGGVIAVCSLPLSLRFYPYLLLQLL